MSTPEHLHVIDKVLDPLARDYQQIRAVDRGVRHVVHSSSTAVGKDAIRGTDAPTAGPAVYIGNERRNRPATIAEREERNRLERLRSDVIALAADFDPAARGEMLAALLAADSGSDWRYTVDHGRRLEFSASGGSLEWYLDEPRIDSRDRHGHLDERMRY